MQQEVVVGGAGPDKTSAVHVVAGVLEQRTALSREAPVVFDSPHSGCAYPDDFRASLPLAKLRRSEDAFVNELFANAPNSGAALLSALFPRSYIDPNRAPDDIDDALFAAPWPEGANPTEKVQYGIGLIARRQPAGEVYDRVLSHSEVKARIDHYYWPYHRALQSLLDQRYAAHRAVWHVNCHSMKSSGPGAPESRAYVRRPDFCLGDRDGGSSEGAFTVLVADTLRGFGYEVSINDPYKGVELVSKYSNPRAGRHSLQIEINRALYMDQTRIEKHEGFAKLRAHLDLLSDVICDYAREQSG